MSGRIGSGADWTADTLSVHGVGKLWVGIIASKAPARSVVEL